VTSVFTGAAVGAPTPVSKPMPRLDCVIEPHTVTDISSKVDGVVDFINVERSDLVKKDQVLVQLDARIEQAAVAYARRRAKATAEVRANQASADFSARRHERVQSLYESAALSEDQMDETGTQKRLAKLELDRAKENLELAGLDLARAQANLAQRTITSPIDGVVVERYLSPGESVEEKPILRIAQIDPLRVEVIVPITHMNDIVVGQQATVSPENPINEDYQATVTIVDRVADAASGTFRVRLTLPNPDYSLPAGLRCEIQFETTGSGPGVVASRKIPWAPRP
jgi:RND family efflux transporter MFP subunit